MKKSVKISLIVIAALLGVAAIGLAVVYGLLGKTYTGDIDIIDRDQPTTTVPSTDDTLDPLESPDDLHIDYNVGDDVEADDVPIYKQVPIDERVLNFVLIGQDTSLSNNNSTRSDSCILVSYNRDTHSIKMVSILRDTWVPIEGHGWNRINAAYSFGRAGLLINTINDVFDLDIQNYVIIGFEEFKECIDELGGVHITLTDAEARVINNRTGSDLSGGECLLNGEQALVYARDRSSRDGDFSRVIHQRNLLLAVYNELKSDGSLEEYLSFASFALNNVKTNITPDELITIAMEVMQADSLNIEYARVPFDDTWRYANKDGRSVISVDLDRNAEMLNEFLYGELD